MGGWNGENAGFHLNKSKVFLEYSVFLPIPYLKGVLRDILNQHFSKPTPQIS